MMQNYLVVYGAELQKRQETLGESTHIINVDIEDNHEEATIGAFLICDLCKMVGPVAHHLILA